MNAKNTIQLIGNLGTNPELVKGISKQTMVYFPMATNDSYKNAKGEKIQDTQWHNVVAFGKLADRILNHVGKGDELLVKGKMTYNQFSNNESKLEKGAIFLKEVIFLSKGKTANQPKEEGIQLAHSA